MATILCVLYDDPVDGYPPDYPRDEIPKIEKYPDGQTTPTPESIDFTPGELLGCVSGSSGFVSSSRRRVTPSIVTSDKDARTRVRAAAAGGGRGDLAAVLARVLDRRADRQGPEPEARDHRRDRLRPRRPAGGDGRGMTVAEVTYCNQHQRLRARGDDDPVVLVRNYIPSYQWVIDGGWNIADCAVSPMTSRGCRSEPWPPAGSAPPCCGA